jgi:hypothetical protein
MNVAGDEARAATAIDQRVAGQLCAPTSIQP